MANEIRLAPGEIILRMVKSASRVKSAKPVADEIPAEILQEFLLLARNNRRAEVERSAAEVRRRVRLWQMKALPKAFPSEGKVAEAARRSAKTDEVEWQLTLNDVRFAHDACRAANDARLRRMMCACGALRLTANEIRLTPGEIILRMVKSASRVKSAKPIAVEIPAKFLIYLFAVHIVCLPQRSLLLMRTKQPRGRFHTDKNASACFAFLSFLRSEAEVRREHLWRMKAFPKAFPSEGKVAEAAHRGAKTDEVEWQLTLNDVRFARDACLRQMMLGFAE